MIKSIQHKGKTIIYVDYRNLNNEEMIETLNRLREQVLNLNQHHLRLVNVEKVNASATFRTHLRKIGKEIGKVPSKVAIVGVPASKRVIINAYKVLIGGGMRLFDNEEEAKEYLVT